MVRMILLMKLTDQGVKDIKSAPQRIDQAPGHHAVKPCLVEGAALYRRVEVSYPG